MSLKVLMIVQSYYPNDPRVRRYGETLVDAGHQVDVISLRKSTEPGEQLVNGVRMIGIPLDRQYGSKSRYVYEYAVFLLWAAWLALRLHLRRRYHVVHMHNLPDTLVFAALLPKLLGARVIFDAHESMPESFRMKFGWQEGSGKFRLLVGLQRLCMSLADHVLTIHEPLRQIFAGRGVPAARSSVVMNWPDDRLFGRAQKAESKTKDGFTLLYAGTIAERYGLQTVIRALPWLAPEIPGLRLRIVGKGDAIGTLQQLTQDLGVNELVSFEAPVPLAQIADVYRAADVGLSPQDDPVFGQIYFSTKVAEYLAVGLPAVVARTPVMAHYYRPEEVAFFTPGDANDFAARVLRIYKDPAYRATLVENGLRLSRQYSWAQERERYLALLSRLAGRRRMSRGAAISDLAEQPGR